jgi:hypothetical protein
MGWLTVSQIELAYSSTPGSLGGYWEPPSFLPSSVPCRPSDRPSILSYFKHFRIPDSDTPNLSGKNNGERPKDVD